MKNNLTNILIKLEHMADSLSEKDNKIIEEIFQHIADLISYEDPSRKNNSRYLLQVNKYLKSKVKKMYSFDELNFDDPSFSTLSKLFINEKNLSKNTAKSLYNKFWRLLEMNSRSWDIYELSNLLAYCLHTEPNKVIPEGARSTIKIIKIFKAIFNSQDEYTQFETFRELIMRFSSESIFKETSELFTSNA